MVQEVEGSFVLNSGYFLGKWKDENKERPSKPGRYLVTASSTLDGKDRYLDIWDWTGKYWTDNCIGIPERNVVAWMELPEVYEG